MQGVRTGSKHCTGVISRCAVSPHGKKFSVVGLAGHGSTGPGLMVSQTGGAASLAQFVFALPRSAGKVPPGFAVLRGKAIPSFPVATQTPMEKMQAGPADPQSSSDQFPLAISGKTKRTGFPRSLMFATSLAFFSERFILPPTGLAASVGALCPASFVAGSRACPDRTKSVQGVQWSTTFRLACVPPEAGVYCTFTNDSPNWVLPSKSPFPVIA